MGKDQTTYKTRDNAWMHGGAQKGIINTSNLCFHCLPRVNLSPAARLFHVWFHQIFRFLKTSTFSNACISGILGWTYLRLQMLYWTALFRSRLNSNHSFWEVGEGLEWGNRVVSSVGRFWGFFLCWYSFFFFVLPWWVLMQDRFERLIQVAMLGIIQVRTEGKGLGLARKIPIFPFKY